MFYTRPFALALATAAALWLTTQREVFAQAKLERPEQVLAPAEAQARGKQLVADLLSRAPEPSCRTNVLRTEAASGKVTEIKVRFQTSATPTNWVATYEVLSAGKPTKLRVTSAPGQANHYEMTDGTVRSLSGAETFVPFAGSEFWVADLGLEFLHWPRQAVIKREMRKGQACEVLESTNPSPTGNSYSKVVSWVDNDSGGIVHADAYDSKGKVFKRFEPSELERAHGRMQVKEIRMSNRSTGSRSWVVFDLGK